MNDKSNMANKVSSECRTYTQKEVDNIIENYRYELKKKECVISKQQEEINELNNKYINACVDADTLKGFLSKEWREYE